MSVSACKKLFAQSISDEVDFVIEKKRIINESKSKNKLFNLVIYDLNCCI